MDTDDYSGCVRSAKSEAREALRANYRLSNPRPMRGLLAILAWPLGIVPAFAFMILASPHGPSGQACALEPMARWQELVMLALLVTPGVLVTTWWWRGRRPAE